jgi:hypothetical protein
MLMAYEKTKRWRERKKIKNKGKQKWHFIDFNPI